MTKMIQILSAVLLLAANNVLHAFEVSGESFSANFTITSLQSSETGSIMTTQGDVDDYGKVYLTYHFKGTHGIEGLGNFTGQIRVASPDGILRGTMQGVWRGEGGKMKIYTYDTHSNGDVVMALGEMDLVAGTAGFTVFPVD
jgi:hypothetical protein